MDNKKISSPAKIDWLGCGKSPCPLFKTLYAIRDPAN